MGWRMGLVLLLALGLALAAMMSLISVGEGPKEASVKAGGSGTDSGEGIRDESREALRDLLRNLDSDQDAAR